MFHIWTHILVQLALVLRVRQSSPIGKQGQTISSRKLILLDHLEPCQQNCFDQQEQDYTSEVLLVQVLTIRLIVNELIPSTSQKESTNILVSRLTTCKFAKIKYRVRKSHTIDEILPLALILKK